MHKSRESSIQELADALNWTWKVGGNVVIPSFALERAQDILFILRDSAGEESRPLQSCLPGQPPFHQPDRGLSPSYP